MRTILVVRAHSRFRSFLPALGIPLCIALVALGLQAVALGRPSRESLVAAAAVHELFRYRVMQGAELLAGRRLSSVCIEGWFRANRHHSPVLGSLVLLGSGERLYDIGHGVRRTGHVGHTTPVDRARFLLAGCPRYLGESVTARLIHADVVDADPTRTGAARTATVAIVFGKPTERVSLLVVPPKYLSIGLRLAGTQIHGDSKLMPGGGAEQVQRVERAFGVGRERFLHG